MTTENKVPPPPGPGTFSAVDPNGPGTVDWAAMEAVARAAACLAALSATFELDTTRMRGAPDLRVAFAWKMDQYDPTKKRLTTSFYHPGETMDSVLAKIRAAHGPARAQEVELLVNPPRKRWFPSRRKT